jgi:uncharacterized membrane protein YoaK (UPF0700 family)
MSETYILGGLLAIVGGYLDAYTYISRGNVFANAQTGNIVFLGLNLAEKNWNEVVHYIIPILAFILGVVTAEMLKSRFKQNPNIHWRQITVAIETVVLLIVAFIPQGDMNLIANIAISFVCSLQVQGFRKFNGNTLTTTMCTGNLRTATEQLFLYNHTKDSQIRNKSLQYYGIILFFIIGAVLGTLLTKIFIEKAILFNCVVLIVVFAIMFIKEDIENSTVK